MYRDYHNITAPTISQNYSLVYNVMNFIHKYYWDDITLDTLSQQFYINKKNQVVIVFNQGEVGPMSMGSQSFVLPKKLVAKLQR